MAGPVLAPAGTGATTAVLLQLLGVAETPLKVTVLLPWVPPKFDPWIVIELPTLPESGVTLLMLGAGIINKRGLLWLPLAVTTTFSAPPPAGTITLMLVSLQALIAAAVPLKVTTPVPWVAPKLAPAMVTEIPGNPEAGDKLVRHGPAGTAKHMPLLVRPLTLTTTFPLVAPVGTGTIRAVSLQLLGGATVPLKVVELLPCVAPKLEPLIVTEVPAGPKVGDRPTMVGPVFVTVNRIPLLVRPPTVTTMFPVVAADGTVVVMAVE